MILQTIDCSHHIPFISYVTGRMEFVMAMIVPLVNW